MRGFLESFRLEFTALVRSGTLVILTALAVVWALVLPGLLHTDGTLMGARELYIRFALGGAAILIVLGLLAVATGTVAAERRAHRLQLALVRAVAPFAIVLGRHVAILLVGALALAAAAVAVGCRTEGGAQVCSHVFSPVMESPAEEAKRMYALYMADTNTPDEVRNEDPAFVLDILEQRAFDHYQGIGTNETVRWKFDLGGRSREGLAVRLRFTNSFNMRQLVQGRFEFADRTGTVSNMTQTILDVPLAPGKAELGGAADELVFRNQGRNAHMLRPRRDISLLVPADSFRWNLLRAYLLLVSLLSAVLALGVLLGTSLGRPVATFTALVLLLIAEMSPSVIERYPGEVGEDRFDRLGLAVSRIAVTLSHPFTGSSPLESLSRDICIERGEVVRALVLRGGMIPLALLLFAAFVMPYKPDET